MLRWAPTHTFTQDTDVEAEEWFKEELQTSVNDFQKDIDNTVRHVFSL